MKKIQLEETEQPIYHVTHTKHVAKIQKLGSGNISIITAHRPKDREFHVDGNDPLSQAGKKGVWIKTRGSIEPHHIVSVEKYMPKKLGEDKIGKQTPSVEEIAKKHNISVDQVNAQIKKGIEVEKEHTNDEGMAHEIARDHLAEFPDYYDRLGSMEKSAKKAQAAKGMKESVKVNFTAASYDAANRRSSPEGRLLKKVLGRKKMVQNDPPVPSSGKEDPVALKGFKRFKDGKFNVLRKEEHDQDKDILKSRIETHRDLEQKFSKKNGEQSSEAMFHRALVKRMEKELGEDINEAKKTKKSKKSWQANARLAAKRGNPDAIRSALKAHALARKGENRKHAYNEEVANSVGGGMSPVIGGEGNIHGTDPIMGKPVRRKKFAGKQVFTVDPTTYHKAYLGKRKYEHYEKYLEGSPMADEIREYGRKYWAEPIIIENEQTGAMVYLKYGSK
jgi:hypothetical protein